jgi:hypothetical protein
MRKDWLEQALSPRKPEPVQPRGPEASHSWAGLSTERTQGPGVGSVGAVVPVMTVSYGDLCSRPRKGGTLRPCRG